MTRMGKRFQINQPKYDFQFKTWFVTFLFFIFRIAIILLNGMAGIWNAFVWNIISCQRWYGIFHHYVTSCGFSQRYHFFFAFKFFTSKFEISISSKCSIKMVNRTTFYCMVLWCGEREWYINFIAQIGSTVFIIKRLINNCLYMPKLWIVYEKTWRKDIERISLLLLWWNGFHYWFFFASGYLKEIAPWKWEVTFKWPIGSDFC